MVTALGLDAQTACAAARAGLSRASTLAQYRVRSAVDGAEEAVVGHAAPLTTLGFEGSARLRQLLDAALADLRRQVAPEWFDAPCPVYVALPEPSRIHGGLDLIADPATRSDRAADVPQDPPPILLERKDAASVLRPVLAVARIPWPGEIAFLSTEGSAGGAAALGAAASQIGTTRRALVLVADSLLDEDTLDWLNACGRLKLDGVPAGLRPGEGAVAVLLSAEPVCGSARIVASATAQDSSAQADGKPAQGRGLSDAIAAVHAPGRPAWIVSDHNGEGWRAADLGHARVRLRAHDAILGDAPLRYPAIGFGDTGCAGAAAGLVVAVNAFRRGYAPASLALIAATSDGALRAALAVEGGS